MTGTGTIVCSACGYDLTGSPVDGACAECGASVAESRRKHFTNRHGEAMVMHFAVGLLGVAAAGLTIAFLLSAVAWVPYMRDSFLFGISLVVGIAGGLAAPIHLTARRVCEPFGGLVWPRRILRLATIAAILASIFSIHEWQYTPIATPTLAVGVRAAAVIWLVFALAGFLSALSNHLGMHKTLRRPTLAATTLAAILGILSTAAAEHGTHPLVGVFLAVLASIAAAVVALLVAAWSYRLLRPLREIMKAAAASTP
ncbi:MAG: hypothetical protein JNM94_15620 [Phycisphaerae bacterium]|nr:hypothetical protein [Phycisphaerae bacterium]